MITSLANTQVKNIIQLNQKAKARRDMGLFVAEGRKMFEEAPHSWIHKVYLTEEAARETSVRERISREQLAYETVADNVFRQMSDTQTPQGILTVLRKPSWSLADVLQGEDPLLVILEDLQDPGNAGTILRTGEGAGISGVILTRQSVDITNPKVIRSTMGSVYRVPYVYVEDVRSVAGLLKEKNIRLYAACLEGSVPYDSEDYAGAGAFLVGNEGNGLSDEAIRLSDQRIRIPMHGQVESLNAAMACGILLYEASRQRRQKEGAK
ncbi:MAG: RNA methyltransferase [Blautia sp.]|nr:RNA methyltransferase [Blautia sp.]